MGQPRQLKVNRFTHRSFGPKLRRQPLEANARPILRMGNKVLLAAMRQEVEQAPHLNFLFVAEG